MLRPAASLVGGRGNGSAGRVGSKASDGGRPMPGRSNPGAWGPVGGLIHTDSIAAGCHSVRPSTFGRTLPAQPKGTADNGGGERGWSADIPNPCNSRRSISQLPELSNGIRLG